VRDRSPRAVWETALGQLELQVTRPNFETWLRNTTGLRLESGTLLVNVRPKPRNRYGNPRGSRRNRG